MRVLYNENKIKDNNRDIKDLDNYKHKEEYYNIICESIRLHNKVWKDYTYAKKMINNNVNDFDKLKLTIKKSFKLNHTYPAKDIKTILSKIYNQFEISKTPKANDLNEFAKLKTIKNKPSGIQLLEYYN